MTSWRDKPHQRSESTSSSKTYQVMMKNKPLLIFRAEGFPLRPSQELRGASTKKTTTSTPSQPDFCLSGLIPSSSIVPLLGNCLPTRR